MFGKKRQKSTSAPQKQYPDELAEVAEQLYATQQFGAAANQFALAIDKLHTMLVVSLPPNRLRQPGPGDQAILDGLQKSVGAAKATGQPFDRRDVETALNYLGEIQASAGDEARRYASALTDIAYELQQ